LAQHVAVDCYSHFVNTSCKQEQFCSDRIFFDIHFVVENIYYIEGQKDAYVLAEWVGFKVLC